MSYNKNTDNYSLSDYKNFSKTYYNSYDKFDPNITLEEYNHVLRALEMACVSLHELEVKFWQKPYKWYVSSALLGIYLMVYDHIMKK